MGDALISVVVPFYNTGELLGECLRSIAAQTHADLEVIIVDDGSTDGSGAIAAAQAAADPRFRLISGANAGPGAARNTGVAAATGEYLAFVDSDDMLPPGAYATLLAVLRETGSDFVSGGVLRLTAAGLGKSGLHARAIKARRLRTHVSRTPELLYDISVWNKLYRRSFWTGSGLSLPEGMLWEDLVAMTKAHVLATAVDVITEPVYHWRDRAADAPSITQSRADIGNLRDRITAFGMIDGFLRERGRPALLGQHQHKALVNDLWLYVRDLPRTSEDYRREFTELAAGYLETVSAEVIADLPATRKLAYYLISHGHRAEFASYAAWLADQPGRTSPMRRVRGRRYADLPYLGDRSLGIPAEVFRPHHRDLDPYVGVDQISVTGGALVIAGWAYVPSVDIGRRRHAGKLLLLMPRGGGRRPPVLLPVRSVRRPDVTARSEQGRYSYDWAGFRIAIGPRLLRAAGRWLTGDWDCVLLVRGRDVWRPARLHSPGQRAEQPPVCQITPRLSLRPIWISDRLQLRLRRGQVAAANQAGARQSWTSDGKLALRWPLPPGGPDGYRVVLRKLDGWDRRELPVSAAQDGLAAVVPVGDMELFGERLPLRDGRWEITLRGLDDQPAGGPYAAAARPVTVGTKIYRALGGGDALELHVGPALGLADRGRVRRKLVREVYYRLQRLLPVREEILLSSFHGKQCGDSPRAIAEELRRRGDGRPQVWAVSDWSVAPPPGARRVLIGTRAYYAALGRSRYLVVNDHVALPYRKRPGQRHVQTWHGVPLKRLGYDIAEVRMASGSRYLDYLASDVAQWDLLLSPNPFSTPIMRTAFGFTGEIAETGYPRDDALVAGPPERAAQVRDRLGIPVGRRVALYVPTWRDDQHDAAGRYLLDFRLDLAAASERLAGQYVLAIRGHHLMAGDVLAAGYPRFALDVTACPDINDLLLVADVLITDYSSVMFDFAPTGKPMLFFTYDLARYRDQVRGFYFDFEADAPGPLLQTSEQVLAALADLDSVAAKYADARAAFTARFCPLDDGKASARACDRIFGG